MVTIADSGTPVNSSARSRFAQALLAQGMSAEPVQHWTQGAARVAQALLGGHMLGQEDRRAQASRDSMSAAVRAILGGDAGTTAPFAPPPTPRTPPVPAVGDMVGPHMHPSPLPETGAVLEPLGGDLQQLRIGTPETPPGWGNLLERRTPQTGGQPGGFDYMAWLRRQEGFNPRAYSDYRQTSIGYGTRARPGETQITQEEAERRLQEEVGAAQALVDRFAPNLTPGQRTALTDLTYNAGASWMQSALGQAVRAGDWARARDLFLQYHNAGGQPLPGLVRRRQELAGMLAGGAGPQAGAHQTPPGTPTAGTSAISPQARAAIGALAQANPTAALQLALQVVTRGEQPTEQQRNYAAYVRDQSARGQPVASFNDWMLEQRRAGATAITTVERGERAFESEAGKRLAAQYTDMVQAGRDARTTADQLNLLAQLSPRIGTGVGAVLRQRFGPILEAAGVRVEGLSETQLFTAIQNQLAPRMRVAGSGATSDFEMRQYLSSLPALINTEGGNEAIARVNAAIAEHHVAAAEIASQALEGAITRSEAERRLRALPSPLAGVQIGGVSMAEWLRRNAGGQPGTAAPGSGQRVLRYNLDTGEIE